MEKGTSVGAIDDESDGEIGAPDVAVMRAIRDLFLRDEPLVTDTSFDSVLSPKELHVEFDDGIGDATWCRLDITWYSSGAYRFHYADEVRRNWRFDCHPNTHSPEKHFHEPPDATSETAVKSCIEVEEPRLVTRAVMNLWRRAYDTDSFAEVNTARNPP